MGIKTVEELFDDKTYEEIFGDETFEILPVDDVAQMKRRLEAKRKSRIWFDPDIRLLEALNDAEKALDKVCSYLVVEGLQLPKEGVR